MARMIGIRVPEDSDLPQRLGILGYKLRLNHGELLARWITAEEQGAVNAGGTTLPLFDGAEVEALREEIKVLREQLAATTGARQSTRLSHEEREAAVTYIKQLHAEGVSMNKIAERLNNENRPTISGGGKWQKSTVSFLLKGRK